MVLLLCEKLSSTRQIVYKCLVKTHLFHPFSPPCQVYIHEIMSEQWKYSVTFVLGSDRLFNVQIDIMQQNKKHFPEADLNIIKR